MREFKQYKKRVLAELRPVTETDIENFKANNEIILTLNREPLVVSISQEDRKNGSPKMGDMVARNPKNGFDQWLVAEQYFKDNFDEL
jgi:hypothetical protein